MKRNIVCLLLALALTLTGCGENGSTKELTPTNEENAASEAVDETDSADAAGQEPGTSSASDNQQAAGSEAAEEMLDETSIGPVSFTPNDNGFSMVYGNTTLHAYFKRQNVVPGDGKFVLHNAADDSVVEEIDLRDNSKCYVAEADSMFYMLGWDNGTHIVIQLKDTPKLGQSYYATLEEGAFTSQDGTIRSKAVTDKNIWPMNIAEYGVLPDVKSGSYVYVGDVLKAQIILKAPAAVAKVENYDENRVRFNEKEFTQSGELEIKIYQIGDDPFNVNFYDNDENLLGTARISYNAAMPPEPEPEKSPAKTVTQL